MGGVITSNSIQVYGAHSVEYGGSRESIDQHIAIVPRLQPTSINSFEVQCLHGQ